jgi:hypothetical protein
MASRIDAMDPNMARAGRRPTMHRFEHPRATLECCLIQEGVHD